MVLAGREDGFHPPCPRTPSSSGVFTRAIDRITERLWVRYSVSWKEASLWLCSTAIRRIIAEVPLWLHCLPHRGCLTRPFL